VSKLSCSAATTTTNGATGIITTTTNGATGIITTTTDNGTTGITPHIKQYNRLGIQVAYMGLYLC
jgi:hypothetical protein